MKVDSVNIHFRKEFLNVFLVRTSRKTYATLGTFGRYVRDVSSYIFLHTISFLGALSRDKRICRLLERITVRSQKIRDGKPVFVTKSKKKQQQKKQKFWIDFLFLTDSSNLLTSYLPNCDPTRWKMGKISFQRRQTDCLFWNSVQRWNFNRKLRTKKCHNTFREIKNTF